MLQVFPPPDPPQAEIVVTAPALPDPAAQRAYAVDEIDASELRNSASGQLDEILKQVPGVQLFRRSDARSGHPTSQGVTLRSLGGNASSRALLILDGVPQADPFGGWVNWPACQPAALAKVEVIRGGGAVGYGPGALAGAIVMTSRAGSGLEAAAFAGSRESLDAHVHVGVPLAKGVATLTAAAGRGHGFIPVTEEWRGPVDRPAEYALANARAQWLRPVGEDVTAQLSGAAWVDERERGVPFTGNLTRGADASVRLVGSGSWGWSATVYGQWREFTSSFASVDDERTSAERVALQDEIPSRAIGGSVEIRPPVGPGLELRLGSDARFSDAESREFYFYQNGEPTRGRRAGGAAAVVGTFAELSARTGPFTLTGGARVDRWQIRDGRLQEWVLATGEPLRDDSFADRSGVLPTGRAGAVVALGSSLSLRSAAYLGWRMPTLNELFRPFRAGADATAANAELDPERIAGVEAGADYHKGAVSVSATLFFNRLSDAIANVTLGRGPGVFPGVGFVGEGGEYRQRQNLPAVVSRGLEASAELTSGPWSFRLGASLVDADVEGRGASSALDGLRPAQTPRFFLTGGIDWQKNGRAASLGLRHVGAQPEDDLNQLWLAPATVLDGFAAWPVGGDLQLVFRGENLLDEQVDAGVDSSGLTERATPRTLWIGLRFGR